MWWPWWPATHQAAVAIHMPIMVAGVAGQSPCPGWPHICLVWWPLWLANRLAFGVRGGHTYAQYGGHGGNIYAQCGGRDSPACVQCGGLRRQLFIYASSWFPAQTAGFQADSWFPMQYALYRQPVIYADNWISLGQLVSYAGSWLST